MYTPEITLNVLSIDQLKAQGYEVAYEEDRCEIKYMFEDWNGSCDKKAENESKKNQDEFLEIYFDSIDPKDGYIQENKEENINWDRFGIEDFNHDDYVNKDGKLFAIKVNSFGRFLSFLTLVKTDSIVYMNWETFRKKFNDMLKWFYLVYLRNDSLDPIPPRVGDMELELLDLYKVVDSMGGYLDVSIGNKWKYVAAILGFNMNYEKEIKDCYRRMLDMVDCYYNTAKQPWFKEEPICEIPTKKVEEDSEYVLKNAAGVKRDAGNHIGCDSQETATKYHGVLKIQNKTKTEGMQATRVQANDNAGHEDASKFDQAKEEGGSAVKNLDTCDDFVIII